MNILKVPFLLLICSVFFLNTSCKKEENKVLEPSTLTGKWVEKESEKIIQFGGTNYIIEFKQDSFFLERSYWTDALSTEDECVNGHIDYYKGIYEIVGTQISFTGKATNVDFILATLPCERATTYAESFEFEQKSEEVLIFNPEQEEYVQIRLEKQE